MVEDDHEEDLKQQQLRGEAAEGGNMATEVISSGHENSPDLIPEGKKLGTCRLKLSVRGMKTVLIWFLRLRNCIIETLSINYIGDSNYTENLFLLPLVINLGN